MLKPSRQRLSMTLLAWEMSEVVRWLARSLILPFLEIVMRIDLFQFCGHCWVLQICWHIDCHTLMASSSRVFHSSPGIPSHPLALFTAVLPKTYLISYSRMSGSGWLTTPFQSSTSSGYFLYSSSVYSFHPFLISLATTKSLPFISFIVLICGQNALLMFPIFLKRFLLFLLSLFSSIIKHCSLKKAFFF